MEWRILARLWLGGAALRLTYLALPPVLPLVQDELRLSATEIGLLTGLPILMLGAAALIGSLLIARLGARRSITAGLLIAAVASGLRGFSPEAWSLYGFTALMGLGVATAQPAMATLVRQWLPHRIGFGTAVYVNGLLVGEIVPVALTIPLVLPMVGGNWRWSLLLWSIPLLAIAALFMAPNDEARTGAFNRSIPRSAWWPDWRRPALWRIGLLFGCTNAMYFGANAFIPGYLRQIGEADHLTAALTALNLGQLPASLILLAVANRVQGRRWPFVAAGTLAAASLLWLLTTGGAGVVVASGLLGFACGTSLIAGLALPPLISAAEDLPRTASGVFTISYALAVCAAVLGGRFWDLAGTSALGFAPLVACGAGQVLLAAAGPLVAAHTAPMHKD